MTTQKPTRPNLYHPRYWPNYLGFLILRVLALLPYPILYRMGKLLGIIMYHLFKSRVRVARTNMEQCFPQHSADSIEALVRDNLISTGIGMMETAMLWFGPQRNWQKHIQIEGMEHYEKALEDGKGALILGFHLTSLEYGGSMLGKRFPLAALYRKNENPVIEQAMFKGRSRFVHPIPRNDTRAMVRWIKDNGCVWYAADQDYGREQSIFVPFFGVDTATITATSRFAKLTKAPVIPFTHERIGHGKGIKLKLHAPLPDIGKNPEADALVINQFLEEFLTQHPAEYLWIHRRFKTRPTENSPSLYPPKGKKRRINAERFDKNIEAAEVLEQEDGRVTCYRIKTSLVYVFYRDKNKFGHTLTPPYKNALNSLQEVTRDDVTYKFYGTVEYCREYHCDAVVLEAFYTH
ncbi:LpxL/LpxP family Kdo(2)-lipid IV(A) lauroyl/palmitoleoyl acyltransferase [Pleionea sp. CnH1-48]|uniref:LpxL/LpxP family Kdo(2)-lipid IV(A) lauroyl/palmitoleoyl acyltransferase n=1 Tax=Pleionea sp. CnH1-48 TaxID=2954494 RepID=UPI0020977241|nr:LpxL/LpxP family Kdo(2)-lipid IV(A) lauroyl/palmitoleoyl acyltransferase [Pleionea sp. CnH1-48]MCO7227313.1 LpxL/LpxP family Kdo(2)-lipid IV(A) lauroyl/palmitoleoyl acyltransferase [Pleionea sp. CnH1-48]